MVVLVCEVYMHTLPFLSIGVLLYIIRIPFTLESLVSIRGSDSHWRDPVLIGNQNIATPNPQLNKYQVCKTANKTRLKRTP